MRTSWTEEFARAVNTLHNLESVWSQAKLKGEDAATIERTIQELVSRMTDEELDAYGEYEKEKLRQAQDKMQRYSKLTQEMEAELTRRKAK